MIISNINYFVVGSKKIMALQSYMKRDVLIVFFCVFIIFFDFRYVVYSLNENFRMVFKCILSYILHSRV